MLVPRLFGVVEGGALRADCGGVLFFVCGVGVVVVNFGGSFVFAALFWVESVVRRGIAFQGFARLSAPDVYIFVCAVCLLPLLEIVT